MAKPKGKGSAVPRIRDVPAVAIVAWVIAIINSVSSEQRAVISALKGATHPTKKRRNYEFLVSDSDIMPTVF
jgi:hypothetical protein